MSILRELRNLGSRFLPAALFKLIRQSYTRFKRLRISSITKQEFKNLLLNKMNIEKGSTLFIHSSLGYLKFDFPVNEIIPVLLEIIGPKGNLLFPSTHFTEKAEHYLKNKGIFNVRRSVSIYGMLTELARRQKGAQRSLHPTTSVVAIGPDAEYFLFEHHLDIYPLGEKSPYFKMMKYTSYVIGLGVSSDYLSFTHCPEDVYPEKFAAIKPRLDDIFEARVINYKNEEMITKTLVAASDNIRGRNVPRYIKKNIPKEIGEDFTYHGTEFFWFKAKPLFDKMVELADKGITIYNP